MKNYIFSLLFFCLSFDAYSNDNKTLNPYSEFNSHRPYLKFDEIPNAIEILPPPPSKNDLEFKNDITKYKEYKLLRNTPRGYEAAKDCELENGGLQKSFSKAFGIEINKANTPILYDLLSNIIVDAGKLAVFKIKQYYKRERPYVYFSENTCNDKDFKLLSNNGSYISGHTVLGWTTALILSEINPKNQTQLLKKGYEFGQSRVICGYHWQSDITNSSIIASALITQLHNNKRFIQDINQAKKEFEKIKHLLIKE